MAKPMSLVWLIAIGLLSFTYVNGDTFKSTPTFGQTADDTGKASLEKGEDDVGNYALEKTPDTWMAQLDHWKDKLEALRVGVGIFAEGYEFYDRTSTTYEKVKKGEISQEEFESRVWKEVGDVVRSWCSIVGKTAGKTVGHLLFSQLGKEVGGYVGEELGEIFGIFLTGERGDDVAKGLILREVGENRATGIHALRLFMKVLGGLARTFDLVIQIYPRISDSYERWNNGELSLRDFQWEVRKDVVRVASPIAGTFAGATLGAWYLGPALGQLAIPIPGLGAVLGGYFGCMLGEMVGEFVTG